MASSSWTIGLSGNWTTGANWSGGEPNSSIDAIIGAFGTYTVTLSTAADANSLILDDSGATLSETATGSLDMTDGLFIDDGRAILRGANTIGDGVTLISGIVETANNGALGTGTFTFSGGELLGLSNESFTNTLTMTGDIAFAAAHGKTLNQDSTSWSFDASDPGSITFGRGGNDGMIVWHTVSGTVTNPAGLTVEIADGTVQGGDIEWGFLFGEAAKTQIDAGATLDVAGYNGVVDNLQGAGKIIDSGGAATFEVIGGGTFSGIVSGAIALDVNSGTLTLTGAQTYTSGTEIDSGATLQLGAGGTTGSISGDIEDDGTLIYDRSDALTIAAAISGAGSVVYEGAPGVTINRAESYSGTTSVTGEKVTTNNGGVFGTSVVTLADSELLVTGTQTMSASRIVMTGNTAIAAAHGKTLTESSASTTWALDGGSAPATLNIGDGANDGTVVWDTGAGCTVVDIAHDFVEVHAGTFKAGDSSFGFLTGDVAGVTVDAGATLALGGFSVIIVGLAGAGNVTAGANASIGVDGGNFGGVISGAASLEVTGSFVVTGANTYTKGTTIDSNSALSLGSGGTTGSVAGGFVDNGTLFIDHSNAFALTGGLSGSGALVQYGTGTTTIDRTETYSGGTSVANGELSIDRAAAIGSGSLALQGGEFLVTNSATFSNQLSMSGDITIAAADGKQINFNSSAGWSLDATNGANLTFGEGSNDGTVLWHTPAGSGIADIQNYTIDVDVGVLKAGDNSFDFLTSNASKTTIESSGTIELAGFTGDIVNLQGTGLVTNTGAAATLYLEGANFAGQIDGALGVTVYDTAVLSGGGNFTGGFTLESGATLNLSHAWAQDVTFASASELILASPGQYTGVVNGYAAGDVVDIRGVDFNSASFSETYNATTGMLMISDGTHSQHVHFGGSYDLGNFSASSDGVHGTDISYAAMGAHPMLASEHPADFGIG
jgi:autotransporter-associated beta strand protein